MLITSISSLLGNMKWKQIKQTGGTVRREGHHALFPGQPQEQLLLPGSWPAYPTARTQVTAFRKQSLVPTLLQVQSDVDQTTVSLPASLF